ncbi:hypothetical protein [Cohnella rhizosphaerae]|uniref:Uncharacterized protein n=1 Tax=Cohnella rhizosphaerae TaxID=1457232 RepID=A0A9X4KPF8_9BACL|nr:hypothetical protein [Cohnella rhizosphaerae]MDG0808380.1 hypothetical protein [Cohnella rhizosphaerae]
MLAGENTSTDDVLLPTQLIIRRSC